MRSSRTQWGRRAGGLALAAAAALVVAACGSSSGGTSTTSASGSKAPVTEAIVVAFTGAVSFEGGAADAGVYPAVYQINKAGGVLGHKVDITTGDTRGDPADAVPIVDKLLATANNLIGVTGPGTSESPTIAPILNSNKITDMIMGGNASFDRNTAQYIWRLIPPDPSNGEAMALWVRDNHYSRVAAVFGTDSGSQGDLPGVVSGVKKIGATIVANVALTPDQSGYQAQVQQVISSHPQVILTESDGPTAATFFGELKQLGGLEPIIGTTATAISSWISPVRKAIGAADFQKYFTAVADGTPKPSPASAAYASSLQSVASKIVKPVNQWVTNPYSGADYDGMIVQGLAIDAAKSISPAVFNKYVDAVTAPGSGKTVVYTYAQGEKLLAEGKKIQYVGATGPVLFDKYHNSFGNEAAERVTSSGSTVVLKVITEQQIAALG